MPSLRVLTHPQASEDALAGVETRKLPGISLEGSVG
jgi:hypothetical protein